MVEFELILQIRESLIAGNFTHLENQILQATGIRINTFLQSEINTVKEIYSNHVEIQDLINKLESSVTGKHLAVIIYCLDQGEILNIKWEPVLLQQALSLRDVLERFNSILLEARETKELETIEQGLSLITTHALGDLPEAKELNELH